MSIKRNLQTLEQMIKEQDAQGLEEQFAQAKQVRDRLVDQRLKEKTAISKEDDGLLS